MTLPGNGPDCSHATGMDLVTGGTTIQLVPYANTPNPGGEYKVWITRLDDFAAACGTTIAVALNLNVNGPNGLSSCSGSYGFDTGHTKTDNYKVKDPGQLSSIAGIKYYDSNPNNGTFDAGEVGIEGWPIKICRLTSTNGGPPGDIAVGECAETFTSALGGYGFVNLGKGDYCLREALAVDTATIDSKQTEPIKHDTDLVYADGCSHDD